MTIYSNECRKTIIQLHKLGKTVRELHTEFCIPKSTIYTWLKYNSKVSIDRQGHIKAKEL